MVYHFGAQLARGDAGERFLDGFFSGRYRIRRATAQEQRRGIDRLFTHRQTGQQIAVEYKTDYVAARTHHAFVETVAVDAVGKAGWAYTSQAEYLMYYVPGEGVVYVLALEVLRRQLPRWLRSYPLRQARNAGYATHGVVVPLDEMEACAEAAISV